MKTFLQGVACSNTCKHLVKGNKYLVKRLELNQIQRFFEGEHLNNLMQYEYSCSSKLLNKTEFERLYRGVIVKKYCHLIKVLTLFMGFEIREPKYVKMKQDSIRVKLSTMPCHLFQNVKPTIYAPINKLKIQLKSWDMISVSGKPKFCGVVLKYNDISIIEFFRQAALGILNYYSPVLNFYAVKKLVNYHLR